MLSSKALCPISPDRGDLFTTTGSRGVGRGPWSFARCGRIEARSRHAPQVRILLPHETLAAAKDHSCRSFTEQRRDHEAARTINGGRLEPEGADTWEVVVSANSAFAGLLIL